MRLMNESHDALRAVPAKQQALLQVSVKLKINRNGSQI